MDSGSTVEEEGAQADQIADRVSEWIAEKDLQDTLIHQWQDAEHRLSIRIKPQKLCLAEAVRGDFPEAKSMRRLMRRIKAADRALDRAASKIATMKATTCLGALSKIEMALRIQQPANLEERPWDLIESAAKQLRELLTGERQGNCSVMRLGHGKEPQMKKALR